MTDKLTLETDASFVWSYGTEFFLETAIGNYLWSDPDYGGTNVITPYAHDYQHWCKHRACIPFGRDKGSHRIGDYCGKDVQLP